MATIVKMPGGDIMTSRNWIRSAIGFASLFGDALNIDLEDIPGTKSEKCPDSEKIHHAI
ncbi:hypothetical protein [Rhizobium leguminosarum]|uniref:hypothetical protein n=1 Tax=Rhizobium leguminosarum TaxID=384 RepID=UPI0035150A70